MRSILFGILALLALIVVSALGAQFFVPLNSAGPNLQAGPDLQVILPGALAQSVDKSQRAGPQAPVGHRQPTAQGVQGVQKGNSAEEAMKKADEGLKKKLQGICRGC
jgi:hypothetical protein